MGTPIPIYRFFQSSLIDPALCYPSPVDSPPTKAPRSDILDYGGASRGANRAQTSSMKVVAGSDSSNQRTWYLQTSLLRRHSAYLRIACDDASISSIKLPSVEPSTFANFVDFMHSNIYSLHKGAADYHPILSHAQAWILGTKMEALTFRDAALRALFKEVEPFARSQNSRAYQSPIRPCDVQYVCENTDSRSVLRHMLFDAVASIWTQSEVLNIGYNMDAGLSPLSMSSTTWLDVYNTYPDFRTRLANSLKVGDVLRSELLRPIEDYISGKVGMKEDEGDDEGDGALRGRGRRRAGLLIRGMRDASTESVRGGYSRGRRSASTESVFGGESGWDEYMSVDDA